MFAFMLLLIYKSSSFSQSVWPSLWKPMDQTHTWHEGQLCFSHSVLNVSVPVLSFFITNNLDFDIVIRHVLLVPRIQSGNYVGLTKQLPYRTTNVLIMLAIKNVLNHASNMLKKLNHAINALNHVSTVLKHVNMLQLVLSIKKKYLIS